MVTLGEWLSSGLIQVDHIIQVAQNTGQNTVKMPFCIITVNDVVYSLCIKALKTRSVKSNCNNNMVSEK